MAIAIFLGVSLCVAIALFALIAPPLLNKAAPEADISAMAMGEDLRRRLAMIEAQRQSGLIGDAQAAEAIVEAQRAALSENAGGGVKRARGLRLAGIAFLALAPALVAGLYLRVGAPSLIAPPPQAPQAAAAAEIAAMPEDERAAMIEGMVASLEAKLSANPEDASGWRMLARSQLVLGRAKESAASYRRLLSLEAGSLEDWRNFAMALAAIDPEQRFPSDPEFLAALDEIERHAPGDMMALFYRGGAARELGDAAEAAEIWGKLLAQMPPDAPVRGTLEALIKETVESGE